MAWTYDVSKTRVEEYVAKPGTIEIEKLKREADLESLLTETTCREIFGSHVYVTVSNFAALASEHAETDRYRRLIQAIHVYQREVNRIVEDKEGVNGLSIHFQGQKLHALLYRPIDNAQVLATRATLLQLVLRDFVKAVFNPAFPNFDNFSIAGGADIGDVIGTKNGTRGDRELLFLGNPANRAAKIIAGNGVLRITKAVFAELPKRLQDVCVMIGDGDVYRLSPLTSDALDSLLDDLREESSALDMTWDREASRERVEEDKRAIPLKEIEYSDATELIDMDTLSVRNNKRVAAASLFADVSGFTKYIAGAETDDAKESALRVFHVIRHEMSCVVRDDYPGVRVQYQGDRVQALYHVPANDVNAVCDDATSAGAAIQSSLLVVQQLLPEAQGLGMAVGVEYGTTLATKLGTRGQRDRICVGEPVDVAAACEEKSHAGEIGISATVFAALPEHKSELFAFDEAREMYVAEGVTADKVERARKANSSGPRYVSTTDRGVTVSADTAAGARPVPDDRPHAEAPLD
jgi:class 3 adenylate cyclase